MGEFWTIFSFYWVFLNKMIRLCWDLVQFWLDFGSIDRTIELFKGSIEPPNLIEPSSSTELELELERFDLSLLM